MSTPAAERVRPTPLWFFAAVTVAAVYGASAAGNICWGGLNADEGFYAIATRAVAHGEMPYRDFGFTQPPLTLYANALPLRLAGFGLFAQRTVNGLWAAGALAIGASWLGRRTTPAWSLALALAVALAAPWMHFLHLGKTYAFTAFLVMIAAWVFLAWSAGWRRNFTLGLLLALGIATRLPAAPFFVLLWLAALWPGRRPTAREAGAAVVGGVIGALGAVVPFWAAAPEQVKFWVLDFHRISVPQKGWHLSGAEIVTLAPVVWLLASAALGTAVMRRRWFTREFGVVVAAAAALAANLLPAGVYDEYGSPFLLPLAVAAAALVFDEIRNRGPAVSAGLAMAVVAVELGAAPILLHRLLPDRWGTASQWLTPKTPPYNRALPDQLAAARSVVAAALAPGAPFVGPDLILAAETGRAVPPELRMGAFSFTDEMEPGRAARLHLVTRAQLDAWYARPEVTAMAFFKNDDLNYNWSMPSFRRVPRDERRAIWARLQRDFFIGYQEGEFFVIIRKSAVAP